MCLENDKKVTKSKNQNYLKQQYFHTSQGHFVYKCIQKYLLTVQMYGILNMNRVGDRNQYYRTIELWTVGVMVEKSGGEFLPNLDW